MKNLKYVGGSAAQCRGTGPSRPMSRRRNGLVAAALAGVLALSACGNASSASSETQGVSDDEVVFGVDAPLTGPAAYVGLGWRLGMQIAVDQVNDHGGINGRKIKVVVVDDKGTTAGGVAAARTLIDREKVFATISGSTSTALVGAVDIYRKQRVPLFDSIASDEPIWNPFSKYVFVGTTVPVNHVAEQTANDIADRFNASRVAILEADDNAQCVQGDELIADHLRSKGIDVVATETITSGATDFTAQIQAIKAADPDLTYLCTLATDAVRYLPAMANAGVSGIRLGATTLGDVNVLKAAGASAEGLYSYLLKAEDINTTTGAMGEFGKLVKQSPDAKNYSLFTILGYTDTLAALQGLKNISGDPTREKYVAGLEELDGFVAGENGDFEFALPIGRPLTYTSDDHIGNKELTLVQLNEGSFEGVSP